MYGKLLIVFFVLDIFLVLINLLKTVSGGHFGVPLKQRTSKRLISENNAGRHFPLSIDLRIQDL